MEWIKKLFFRKTVVYHQSDIPKDVSNHMDKAFKHMDNAFGEIDKAFKSLDENSNTANK